MGFVVRRKSCSLEFEHMALCCALSRDIPASLAAKAPAPQIGAGACGFFGGDACESNTPETFCAPHNGFEGRGAHQDPSISKNKRTTLTIIRQNGRKRCKMQKNRHLAGRGPFPKGPAANRLPSRPGRAGLCVVAVGELAQKSPIIADSRAQHAAVVQIRTFASGVFPDGEMMGARFADRGPTMRRKPVITVQKGRWGEAPRREPGAPPVGNPGGIRSPPRDGVRRRRGVGGGAGLTRAWGPARAGRRRGA